MKDKIRKYFEIPKSRRMIYDYIRVLACIGIIGLHATGDRNDLVGVSFETLSRIALPMFVLLSGVLVLGSAKSESYFKFYGKRFVKIVIPYLIYGAVYFGWVHAGHTIPESITWDKLAEAIKRIPVSIRLSLEEPLYFHLWFMMMIIGFYVVAPFIKKGIKALDEKDLKMLFAVMIIVYAAIDYFPLKGYHIGIINFFPEWMIYFLAGYIISQFEKKRPYLIFSAVMGVLATILMFSWKYFSPDTISGNFYDLAPHMMIATCGGYSLMILLEPYITKCKWLNWIIMKLSKYTFSIYMIHGIILTNHDYANPGIVMTVGGTLTQVFVVFFRCIIFAVIFDNLITFNIQRIIYFIDGKIRKGLNEKAEQKKSL